jgi:hypothetical protein
VSLSPRDRALIEAQPFDPMATIAFHELAGCLAWSDEVPAGLSADGSAYVRDLLTARGYVHRGVGADAWELGGSQLAARWSEANAMGLRWNGFRRLVLTPPQRAVFERFLADDREL